MGRRAIAWAALGLAGSGFTSLACGRVLSIEEPPDLEPIVADYQRPSGRLSDAAMPRLAARVEQTFASLSRNDGFRFADALVSAMTPSASDLDIDRQFGVDLDGVRPLARDELVATLEADLTCSGTSSSPDEASGEVRVLGAVDRDGLFPTFWGRIEGCSFSAGSLSVQLDGELAVWVDAGRSRIRTSDLDRSPLVLAFTGTTTVDSKPLDLEIDARRTRTRRLLFEGGSLQLESLVIETRVELDDATFVIGFAETQLLSFLPRTLSFIVRASDGLWVCTSLVGAGVGACEDQITGGRVTW
jgi:hypothetical protein